MLHPCTHTLGRARGGGGGERGGGLSRRAKHDMLRHHTTSSPTLSLTFVPTDLQRQRYVSVSARFKNNRQKAEALGRNGCR